MMFCQGCRTDSIEFHFFRLLRRSYCRTYFFYCESFVKHSAYLLTFYCRSTIEKDLVKNVDKLSELGFEITLHDKMPDVV